MVSLADSRTPSPTAGSGAEPSDTPSSYPYGIPARRCADGSDAGADANAWRNSRPGYS